MDDNPYTRQMEEMRRRNYFLKAESENPVSVYDVTREEDFDLNIVYRMFRDDEEIVFTIYKDLNPRYEMTRILGHMEVNGGPWVYLKQFSILVQMKENQLDKDITFSYTER